MPIKREASQMAQSPEEPEWAPEEVEFDFSAKKKPGSYDRILTVDGVDFHVIKAHLAMHSEFFNGMFFPPNVSGGYMETNLAKGALTGVDPATFQYFLELIGGGNRLDDSNILEVLRVSKMWLCVTALYKCEQFLIETSGFSRMERLDLALQYELNELKMYLFHTIITVDDFEATIPVDVTHFDTQTLRLILQKTRCLLRIERPRPVAAFAPYNRNAPPGSRQDALDHVMLHAQLRARLA